MEFPKFFTENMLGQYSLTPFRLHPSDVYQDQINLQTLSLIQNGVFGQAYGVDQPLVAIIL